MATRFRLDPGVSVTVLASAKTERDHLEDFGCGLQGRASREVRLCGQGLVKKIRRLGKQAALAKARELVGEMESSARYRALCTKGILGGRRRLKKEILFPPPGRERPRFLHLRREAAGLDFPVEGAGWPVAGELFRSLLGGASSQELRRFAADRVVGELVGALWEAGWLVPFHGPVDLPTGNGRALFVGHNTVLVASRSTRVLVDPWFRPTSAADGIGYAPLQPADVGPVDAVLITHGHGDHFHLGSLLPFGPSVRVIVPSIERDSLLSSNLAARLRAAGFRNVNPLAWWKGESIGDIAIEALPFYGEQPTSSDPLYEGLWNEGNTYVVRTPGLSCAFLADSGQDIRGNMQQVARRVAAQGGGVDVVFTGTRGFRLFPLFYGFTTVDAYLANVPAELLTEPQQLMSDSSDGLTVGAAFGARQVVPYADGGAPWFRREGMGPRYPGYPATEEASISPAEELDSDPFPERLSEVRRKAGRGPASLILRPGDAFRLRGKTPEIHRYPGFAWPFDQPRSR